MDRRGRGESGDAENYSALQEGRDVAAVVDWIGEPVNLLGHSYGATCCLEAALLTGKLHKLVLYEPGHRVPGSPELVSAELLARFEEQLERNDREGMLVAVFRDLLQVTAEQLAALRADPSWAGRVASAHTIVRESRAELEYDLDLHRFQTMRTPTLMVQGGDSLPAIVEITRTINAALPNSRLHVLPGQQHLAISSAPDEFVAAVTSFLLS
jgi:pimeloyl-ACP methyl ester carboxylesterase